MKIKILGHSFELTLNADTEPNMGIANLPQGKINIAKMPATHVLSTLLHEISHMGADIHQVNVSEEQINVIAMAINSFLIENPEISQKLIKQAIKEYQGK